MSKIIISSEPDTIKEYFSKIWQYRALIFVFARRDLKIKYAQTTLGLSWTIVQPLTAVIVFTIFFSVLLDFDTDYPYVLFVLSGILNWGLFNYIFSQGSTSLMQNQEIIRKMYFPKILLPVSKVLLGLVEFGITIVLLFLLMIIVNAEFKITILLFPLFLIPLIFLSLGLSLILSAATLKNRDLNHIIPFLVNFGIWFTPVFYPVSLIPEPYENFLYLNPMASIIQLFRWSFFGEPINLFILIGLVISFVIFIVGFLLFKKIEDKIIDVL